MADKLRELLYPITVILMIAVLWAYAWAQSLESQLALPGVASDDPALYLRAMADGGATQSIPARTTLDPVAQR